VAQQRDRGQQVPGADAGPDLTGRGGRVEQRAQGRFELLVEVAGQGVKGRIAGVQGRGQAPFGRQELGVLTQPARQRRGPRLARGRRRRRGAGVDPALQHGHHQVRALREVPVQRADPDAGQVSDLLRGRVHAGPGEHGPGRLEQGADVALCVSSHRPRPSPRLP
jgi:hypothetical protein